MIKMRVPKFRDEIPNAFAELQRPHMFLNLGNKHIFTDSANIGETPSR